MQNRTEDTPDEVEYRHPSYGMIRASRISGGIGRLFGSAIASHHSSVRITLVKGFRRVHLNHDWFHGEGQIEFEVELSPAQWAEFITSMNMGSGVPCTIRYDQSGQIENPPETPLIHEHVENDFRRDLGAIGKGIRERLQKLDPIVAKLNKKDQEAVRHAWDMVLQDIESNIPWALKTFGEAAERVKTTAKAEIDAFLTHAIHVAGVSALALKGKIQQTLGVGESQLQHLQACGTQFRGCAPGCPIQAKWVEEEREERERARERAKTQKCPACGKSPYPNPDVQTSCPDCYIPEV